MLHGCNVTDFWSIFVLSVAVSSLLVHWFLYRRGIKLREEVRDYLSMVEEVTDSNEKKIENWRQEAAQFAFEYRLQGLDAKNIPRA